MHTYSIKHITKYSYQNPISYTANQIKLFPIADNFQHVTQHVIKISEDPFITIDTDYFGNKMGTFTINKIIKELTIESEFTITLEPHTIIQPTQQIKDHWLELKLINNNITFFDFLIQEPMFYLPELITDLNVTDYHTWQPLEFIQYINSYIYNNFKYLKGITTIETKLDEIWRIKSGVCQDFALLMLRILRYYKFPARYVSGYICSQNHIYRGEGATHAWVEVYLPFMGWIGLDPTNNCLITQNHVRLAVGRHFDDCSPVKGIFRGNTQQVLEVQVFIQNNLDATQPSLEVFNELKPTNFPLSNSSNLQYQQ